MPVLDATDRSDFLRRQVLTSRNVRGGRLTDFALGGLNYQIEHHLFPSMPRPNLRRSQALIEAFCRQQGVPYGQASLAGSYAQALRHLNTVGRPARPGTPALPAAREPAASLPPALPAAGGDWPAESAGADGVLGVSACGPGLPGAAKPVPAAAPAPP
jgi:hypothetical protein